MLDVTNYLDFCVGRPYSTPMTPEKIRNELRRRDDRIDPGAYVDALRYVRDDGRGG